MWDKKIQWLAGVAVLVLVALLINKTLLPVGNTLGAKTEKTVVIDPGHGGMDPGKIGVNDALEKDINLSISKYVKEYLTEEGIKVIMTREDEGGLYSEYSSNKKKTDMYKRCEIIKEADPLIAVSIHQNSYHQENVSGCQVFYFRESKQGERLAKTIQETMTRQLKPDSQREAKANDSYYMLCHTVAPTVIVECGFLSNWKEAQLLVTREYQEKVARAVADGILTYLEESELTGHKNTG